MGEVQGKDTTTVPEFLILEGTVIYGFHWDVCGGRPLVEKQVWGEHVRNHRLDRRGPHAYDNGIIAAGPVDKQDLPVALAQCQHLLEGQSNFESRAVVNLHPDIVSRGVVRGGQQCTDNVLHVVWARSFPGKLQQVVKIPSRLQKPSLNHPPNRPCDIRRGRSTEVDVVTMLRDLPTAVGLEYRSGESSIFSLHIREAPDKLPEAFLRVALEGNHVPFCYDAFNCTLADFLRVPRVGCLPERDEAAQVPEVRSLIAWVLHFPDHIVLKLHQRQFRVPPFTRQVRLDIKRRNDYP
mmetsp:Transcript_12621/g.35471  ORF Transcript_12621/g.35471 Transcript_12621/m.35471 type:complete len:294 (+) Transcript_12621:1318-2199(+)